MVQRRSWLRAHACEVIKRRVFGSWMRLRSIARRFAPLRGSGLPLLVALALNAIGLLAAPLALSVLGLTVLGLTILGLAIPAAAFLARRQIGGRRLLVL